MAMTVHVDVVSAEASIFSGLAEMVVVPGEMGELGIYPRHTALMTRIKPGSVRIKRPDQEQEELIYVSGGAVRVLPPPRRQRASRDREPGHRPPSVQQRPGNAAAAGAGRALPVTMR